MNDDLFLRYGRAVYEAAKWARETEKLHKEITRAVKSDAATLRTASRSAAVNKKPAPRAFLTSDERLEFRHGGRYFGLIAKLARELGVPTANLNSINSRDRKSPLNLTALRAAMAKADCTPAAPHLPFLTAEEHTGFLPGGRYYGIQKSVALKLGVDLRHVYKVTGGRSATRGQNILAAVRAEMARVDAGIVAKSGGAL